MKGIVKGNQENRQKVFLLSLNKAANNKRVIIMSPHFDELSVTLRASLNTQQDQW